MGNVVLRRARLIGAATDTEGDKAGIVLSRDELIDHTRDLEIDWWWTGDDEKLRVRSEEFLELVRSGEGMLGMGGELVDPNKSSTNGIELSGRAIRNGYSRVITAGDIVFVPAAYRIR